MNLIQEIVRAVPDADLEEVFKVLPALGTILGRQVQGVAFTLTPLDRQVFVAADLVRETCGSPPGKDRWTTSESSVTAPRANGRHYGRPGAPS